MKLNTLKKREHFVEMSKNGSKVAARGVVVECLKYSDDSISFDINTNNGIEGGKSTLNQAFIVNSLSFKLGFTASKKVGKSVYRNKAKRRLREAVRVVISKNPKLFRAGYHYNFIARYTTISRPFESLIKDVKYALHNIYKED